MTNYENPVPNETITLTIDVTKVKSLFKKVAIVGAAALAVGAVVVAVKNIDFADENEDADKIIYGDDSNIETDKI